MTSAMLMSREPRCADAKAELPLLTPAAAIFTAFQRVARGAAAARLQTACHQLDARRRAMRHYHRRPPAAEAAAGHDDALTSRNAALSSYADVFSAADARCYHFAVILVMMTPIAAPVRHFIGCPAATPEAPRLTPPPEHYRFMPVAFRRDMSDNMPPPIYFMFEHFAAVHASPIRDRERHAAATY